MSLEVSATQETLNQFRATVNNGDSTLTRVQVIGPAAKIAELRNGTGRQPVSATVHVEPGDEQHPDGLKPVRFVLPEGVRVSPADEARMVPVRLQRREAGGGSGP